MHRLPTTSVAHAPLPLAVFASRPRARQALTLIEVILVLALLVVIGSVTVPLLSGSISHAQLQHSGELVRAAWGKARLAAMRSGQPYVFRYEPKGSRYQIVLLSAISADSAGDVNTLTPEAEEHTEYVAADILRLSRSRLLEDVVFASGEVAAVPQLAAAAGAGEGGWSEPIVFYPDGTSADAALLLANASGATLRVTLRGLTGVSRTGEIGSEATP
jgi:type II secretory pathway pseudopilin PulG